MIRYILPLALLALTGCQTAGNVNDNMLAGQKPATAADRRSIAEHARVHMKDPYSIRDAEISYTMPNGKRNGQDVRFVCFRANAKNSYGAYTGIQSHSAGLYPDGSLTDVSSNVHWCNKPGMKWQRFSELENIRSL
ncbi:hypothetical protein FHV99_004640 [Ochrobactrum sp. P20RRXII]|nr:hypothetical protein [Ochrobactrum sp. P20RRXII]NIH77388.1 hypothetical protein [Ochrobactrum sp. P20RRXII]